MVPHLRTSTSVRPPSAQVLIKYQARLDQPDTEGTTPLLLAMRLRNMPALQAMCAAPGAAQALAAPCGSGGLTVMHEAAGLADNSAALEILAKAGGKAAGAAAH